MSQAVYVISKDALEKTISMKEFYEANAARTLSLATKKLGTSNLIVRPLQPSDLGLSTNEFSFTTITTSGTVNIIDYTVPNGKYIYLFGLFDGSPTPVVQGLQLASGAGNLLNLYFQDLYLTSEPIGFFNVGIGFEPSNILKANVISSGSSATELFGLIGFVAEPAGLTMNLPQY